MLKRPVTRYFSLVTVCFFAIIALFNLASAQGSPDAQTAQGTQNLAIPGPIMDAWRYVNDLSNQLQSKLPKYSIINEENAAQRIQEKAQSFNYNSLNGIFGEIAAWYNNNVNLANAPGFIDKVTNIIKRAIELLAQGITWLVGRL